ncbi:MAG: hypothetical protein R3F20_08260 [Planctomycetota bacterium]
MRRLFDPDARDVGRLGTIGGFLLILAMLVPAYAGNEFGRTELSWVGARSLGSAASALAIQLAFGVGAILASRRLEGRRRAGVLAAIPIVLFLVLEIAAGDQRVIAFVFPLSGPVFRMAVVVSLSIAATFVGWSLIAHDRDRRRRGRILTGLAASLGIMMFLVSFATPIRPEPVSVLGELLAGDLWRESVGLALILFTTLAYLVIALIGAIWARRRLETLGASTGVLFLLAIPSIVAIELLAVGAPALLLVAFKLYAWIYALHSLLWLGVSQLLIEGPAFSPLLARPAATTTADDLRSRLDALEALRTQGILDDEEWARKRRQIVDEAVI